MLGFRGLGFRVYILHSALIRDKIPKMHAGVLRVHKDTKGLGVGHLEPPGAAFPSLEFYAGFRILEVLNKCNARESYYPKPLNPKP